MVSWSKNFVKKTFFFNEDFSTKKKFLFKIWAVLEVKEKP